MKYKIEFKPRALKDGGKIPKRHLKRIFSKIEKDAPSVSLEEAKTLLGIE